MLKKITLPIIVGSALCLGADKTPVGINACVASPLNITEPVCVQTKASKLLALGTACAFVGNELYLLATEGAASTMTARAIVSVGDMSMSTLVPDLSPLDGFAYQCGLIGSIYAGYLPVAHYGSRAIESIKKRFATKAIVSKFLLGKDTNNQDVYIILYNRESNGLLIQFVQLEENDKISRTLPLKIALKSKALLTIKDNGILLVDAFINKNHVERYYQFSEKMSAEDFNQTCLHIQDFLQLITK